MSETLKKIAKFLELEVVDTSQIGKPPAKVEEKPVRLESSDTSQIGKPPQAPSASAIEPMKPQPVEPLKLGEEGKRRRIKI